MSNTNNYPTLMQLHKTMPGVCRTLGFVASRAQGRAQLPGLPLGLIYVDTGISAGAEVSIINEDREI